MDTFLGENSIHNCIDSLEPEYCKSYSYFYNPGPYQKLDTKEVLSFLLKLIGLIDNQTKSLIPMLDKYVPTDNSQTVDVLNWEPMPLDQAFIDHANSIMEIKNSS